MIHANIVQTPTFLGRFQTFGGQCMNMIFVVWFSWEHLVILFGAHAAHSVTY